MGFFTNEFLEFFEELENNNNKEWFNENRSKYDNHVKNPFKDFAYAVVNKILEFDDEVDSSPYIFRINYDLRFRPDRDPYKTNRTASFSPGGRKSASPGYYISLGHNGAYASGGLWEVSTKLKNTVREYISDNLAQFQKLTNEKKFSKFYGKMQGKTNKRIAKNVQDAAIKEPLIYNTQWYFSSEMPPEIIISDRLLDELVLRFKAAFNLNKFFRNAMIL